MIPARPRFPRFPLGRPIATASLLLLALALLGCGGAGGRTAATATGPTSTAIASRPRNRRAAQPPSSSLPYEQHLLPFHAAPLGSAQRQQLVNDGQTSIPVRLKKPGSLSAFGQAQLGLSVVRVANATPVNSTAGTADLELRLTDRARRLLSRGGSMLIYVAIRFSGSRIRQQLTVPLHG